MELCQYVPPNSWWIDPAFLGVLQTEAAHFDFCHGMIFCQVLVAFLFVGLLRLSY